MQCARGAATSSLAGFRSAFGDAERGAGAIEAARCVKRFLFEEKAGTGESEINIAENVVFEGAEMGGADR